MIKQKRNKKSNQGNSFIVVVATISFLLVLASALLVAVALCFRLKAYDINSRDNFYYLEQAMDEIYEGIGHISMKHLNEAFDETAEVIVYYDTVKKAYVTMDNTDANKLMKATYISKLKSDSRLQSTDIENTLISLLSNPYSAADNPEGVQLSLNTNVIWSDDNEIWTLKDIVLKREAKYSTVNTRKETDASGNVQAVAATTFIQTITTDLTVSMPDFEVDFASADSDISELYDFVMISDMGVEIKGIGTSSQIIGNVYAAADFYNKKYNENPSAVGEDSVMLNNQVNSYSDTKLESCNGVGENSMYSGFYVNQGAKVSIMADKLIVPGSIAAMDCATLNVIGNMEGGITPTKVWADSIILGGYSRKKGVDSTIYTGSNLTMKADTHVYDDLEVNAAGSVFSLNGAYYGYNYAATDNRAYSKAFLKVSKERPHYNSSAIVINGEDSTLDLSKTDSIYIAGQAYVEMAKSATKTTHKVTNEGGMGEEVSDDDPDDGTEKIIEKTYGYEDTSVDDYRTGEALSVKSNQLAYIPPYTVEEDDTDGSLYVKWPSAVTASSYFADIWDDLSKVPVIVTQISGSKHYFYDFSKAKDGVTMNKYMEEYAKLFELLPGQTNTTGDLANLYDITDYDAFEVNKIDVDASKIYSNSAISLLDNNKVTIKAKEESLAALEAAKGSIDAAIQPDPDSNTSLYSQKITGGLQKEYKEMKMLLTDSSSDTDAISYAYSADEGGITPINYYFDFSKLDGIIGSVGEENEMDSGYKVFLGKDDVTLTTSKPGGKLQGIVICKGDVTFDSSVTKFEGLIVSGGKIITNHSIDFFSNPEIVKSVLRECDESKGGAPDRSAICSLFRKFESSSSSESDDSEESYESMKAISAVQYEDILAFKNWKKNVD